MECVYFEFEEFVVTESVGLSFHGFDFVVGSFEWSVQHRGHFKLYWENSEYPALRAARHRHQKPIPPE